MSRHAACRHADYVHNDVALTCNDCNDETFQMSTAPRDAFDRSEGFWFDVYPHGGAHRAEPVSLYKFPPAFAAFVATLEWDEEPALVADELDLPRHLFAR